MVQPKTWFWEERQKDLKKKNSFFRIWMCKLCDHMSTRGIKMETGLFKLPLTNTSQRKQSQIHPLTWAAETGESWCSQRGQKSPWMSLCKRHLGQLFDLSKVSICTRGLLTVSRQDIQSPSTLLTEPLRNRHGPRAYPSAGSLQVLCLPGEATR